LAPVQRLRAFTRNCGILIFDFAFATTICLRAAARVNGGSLAALGMIDVRPLHSGRRPAFFRCDCAA
jgi:hypothetical protein